MISMSKRHHIVEDDEGSSAITRYYLRSLEPYELNEREQTAALMTIKGCTQKEIASFLNVSESTVKLALRTADRSRKSSCDTSSGRRMSLFCT